MGLCAALSLAANQTAFAQEHKEHKEGSEKVKILDTVDGILKEIHKHRQELADTVKAKKLADVHHHAFAIRDLAKALPAKAHPDHKKMVENAVTKVSQLAEDLGMTKPAAERDSFLDPKRSRELSKAVPLRAVTDHGEAGQIASQR